jgi:AraC-like DNA-binding protein
MHFKGIPYIKLLKSKLFIGATIIPLFSGILYFIYLLNIHDLNIFPNNDYLIDFYTDSSIGGNSKIISKEVTDNILRIDFVLDITTSSPYVGIKISRKDNKTFDISNYDQLEIKVNGDNINKIGVAIFTSIPTRKNINNVTEIHTYSIFSIDSESDSYNLDLNQFNVPDWWNEKNNIDNKLKPDLKNVTNINISNGLIPQFEKTRTLKIYSISFSKNYKQFVVNFLIIEFIVAFSVLLILVSVEKFRLSKKSVVITYRPVENNLKDKSKADFIGFINNNFQNSQLTIDVVSGETGVNQRKITNDIQNQFKCNFKTYINRLRINESKRLLIESKLNMGEIAFKVGFNNQSHFNRVFKSEMGISPTDFRQKKGN